MWQMAPSDPDSLEARGGEGRYRDREGVSPVCMDFNLRK